MSEQLINVEPLSSGEIENLKTKIIEHNNDEKGTSGEIERTESEFDDEEEIDEDEDLGDEEFEDWDDDWDDDPGGFDLQEFIPYDDLCDMSPEERRDAYLEYFGGDYDDGIWNDDEDDYDDYDEEDFFDAEDDVIHDAPVTFTAHKTHAPNARMTRGTDGFGIRPYFAFMEIVIATEGRWETEREISEELREQIRLYEQIATKIGAAQKAGEHMRGGLEKLGDAAKTVGAHIAGAYGARQLETLGQNLARAENRLTEAQLRAFRRSEEAAKRALERMDQDRERAFARMLQNETARFSAVFAPMLSLARQASSLVAAEADAQTRNGLQTVQNHIAAAQERLQELQAYRSLAEGDEKARLEREILNQRAALEQMHADRALYERRRDEAVKKAGQIKKAVAVAETIANTAVAVTKALAEGGPTLGPILAGVVAALGAAQTATVAVQQFSQGTLAVRGGVPGKDSVPALLTPGEAVTPAREARDYRAVLEAIHRRQIPPDEMQRRLFQNVHVAIDERGFRLFVQQSGDETRFLERRYRTYD